MKKIGALASDLAERLSLPEDALLGAAKLSVTAGKRALVENHRGILEYGPERIVVAVPQGRISLSGSGMQLLAMNGGELLIGGDVKNVEWE